MNLFKKAVMIGLSVAGTVMGAGFATGKEIMLFFPKRGVGGVFSLLISVVIMAVVSLLYCCKRKNKLDKIFDFIFILFLAASFSVMLACGGETLNEALGLSEHLGVVITYIIGIFIIHFNLKGIYAFNLIASPLMIIFTLIISINAISSQVFLSNSPQFLSISYSGYNLLSLVPFLKSLKAEENNDKLFIKGTALGIFAVLICGIFIKLTLDTYFNIILDSEIPMLKIANLTAKHIGIFHSILIYSAILTTAVSSLLVLKEKGNIYFLTAPLLVTSFFGFGSLIKNIYGFFGYIGIVFIIYIIIAEIFYKKEN